MVTQATLLPLIWNYPKKLISGFTQEHSDYLASTRANDSAQCVLSNQCWYEVAFPMKHWNSEHQFEQSFHIYFQSGAPQTITKLALASLFSRITPTNPEMCVALHDAIRSFSKLPDSNQSQAKLKSQ
ncbi:hypothetical protein D5018_14070 [Parashewanella curva]|uniref:Uncharacterized protein n=1 Tax=Parashewanella curva TaxID=2338552 RepID=A0A3L8PYE3_9GAMM|nr:hypothetical protein [Parashewanella curva]RLV59072.1 hypothetical protein D5018_14070 [Parashewanella curva]